MSNIRSGKKPSLLHPLLIAIMAVSSLQACKIDSDSSSAESSESLETTETNDSSTESETVTNNSSNVSSSDSVVDITNAIFTARGADCASYENNYEASVLDIQEATNFDADVMITHDDTSCTFSSNSIPNHDFNDETAMFAGGNGQTAEVALAFTVTRSPEFAETVTELSQNTKNGIFLNGVKLDILSAGCYRPSSNDAGADGNTHIGCMDGSAWLLDPLSTDSKFGADQHNAHIQPGGQYHYHGNPNAMFDDFPSSEGSPVIGFAADGFPIYGSYFYDTESGSVRKATSSYRVKDGPRVALYDPYVGEEINPSDNALNSENYDGTYVDDWEYVEGLGDLDECNGMTIDGQYGYYTIDSYPWVIKCFKGTPHQSFSQDGGGMPEEGQNVAMPPEGMIPTDDMVPPEGTTPEGMSPPEGQRPPTSGQLPPR